jgi:hypothetical protein
LREEHETVKNEHRGMHPKSFKLSDTLIISAAPRLLLGAIGDLEHRRELAAKQLSEYFRYPLFFFVLFGHHTETTFTKRAAARITWWCAPRRADVPMAFA